MDMSHETCMRTCHALLVVEANKATGGVVVPIVVAAMRPSGRRRAGRVQFGGSVPIVERTRRHTRRVVLRVVTEVLTRLGLPLPSWSISVGNADATSVQDLALEVSGFSADGAIFLGLLASALELPIPTHLAVTSHIASTEGRLAPVRGLPTKVWAARQDPRIECVLHTGTWTTDGHCDDVLGDGDWVPELPVAPLDGLELVAMDDVAALCHGAFSESAVLHAGLRHGFFAHTAHADQHASIIDELVDWFGSEAPARFWQTVADKAAAGDVDSARSLLEAYCRFHVAQDEYPGAIGQRLTSIYDALPPAIRRTVLDTPLLNAATALELTRLARPNDLADVQRLLNPPRVNRLVNPPGARGDSAAGGAAQTVDFVIERISADAIAERIHAPLDLGRATYVLNQVTAGDYEEFLAIVTSFCAHMSNVAGLPRWNSHPDADTSAAQQLVEDAFRREGGFDAAVVEGRSPLRGGLRYVLDRIIEHLKHERATAYAVATLRQTVDPMDEQEMVAITAELMRRIGDGLPAHLRNRSPALLAHRHTELMTAYVRSLDQVNEQLRCF
jgi:hypothetical protein